MARRRLPWDKLCWEAYDNEPTLRLCSWAAQGVWPRLLKLMWFSPERGYLLLPGGAPTIAELAELWGKPPESIPPLICELEARGVCSRDARGVLYCRRMARDEAARVAVTQPSATDREVADQAVEAALVALSADVERKAKGAARSARYRSKKKAERTLAQLRAYAHMEAEASRSDSVTPSVTVTSPASRVTSRISCEIRDLRAVSAESESESDLRVSQPPEPPRSLASLAGVERGGDGFEGLRDVVAGFTRRRA